MIPFSVLQVGRGLTNREIGEQLHLSEKTIKHYITNILGKLHVRSRVEAAMLAVRGSRGDTINLPRSLDPNVSQGVEKISCSCYISRLQLQQ
jgi:hypothetical protein